MYKKIVFFFFVICITSKIIAQEKVNYGQVKKLFLKANVIAPGGGVEYGISPETSLSFLTHLGFSFKDYTITYGNYTTFELFLTSSLSFRYYYNLYKRAHNSIDVNGFSANYVTVILSYRYPTKNIVHHIAISPAWGIQRRIEGIGNIDLSIGPGVIIIYGEGTLTYGGHLGIGFVF